MSLHVFEAHSQLLRTGLGAAQEPFIRSAGFRTKRTLQLTHHGQLFINPDAVVRTDAACALHQVFNGGHVGAELVFHVGHFARQFFRKLDFTHLTGVTAELAEHLPHEFRRFPGRAFQRLGGGVGDHGDAGQFVISQPGHGGVDIRGGFHKLHRRFAITHAEFKCVVRDFSQGIVTDTPRTGFLHRVKHLNGRVKRGGNRGTDAPQTGRTDGHFAKRGRAFLREPVY